MPFMWTVKKLGNCGAWTLVSLSLTGCLVTSIPSHTNKPFNDQFGQDFCALCQPPDLNQEGRCRGESMSCDAQYNPVYAATDDCEYGPGLPLPLPAIPVPNFLARWHTKEELPEAPPYPRFHPLPTRPMFSKAENGEDPRTLPVNFGQ